MESEAEWRYRVLLDPPPRTHTIVAEESATVVGFAMGGSARDSNEGPDVVGELYAIYVLPASSGLGIGQALMDESLDRLLAEGFTEAILWVLEDNPRTRRFYELAGWHLDGGVKEEELLGTLVRELRYRIALRPAR